MNTGRLSHGRQSAQIMALFALLIPALFVGTGLAIDGGNLYLQRRLAQNAADAAALAGAKCLYRQASVDTGTCRPNDSSYTGIAEITGETITAPTLDAYDGLDYWAWKNSQGGLVSVVTERYWIRITSPSPLTFQETAMTASNCCDANSPTDAGGVRVKVRRTFPPYFISIALGLLGEAATNTGLFTVDGNMIADAEASSMVSEIAAATPNLLGPWAVCGNYAIVEGNEPTAPSSDDDDDVVLTFHPSSPYDFVDLLENDGTVNYGYAGWTFVIQDNNMNSGASGYYQNPPVLPSGCPWASGSSWKGKIDLGSADAIDNGGVEVGEEIPTATGNGNVGDACASAYGSGTPAPCYLLIGVATGSPSGAATMSAFACMLVQSRSGNTVAATLAASPDLCPAGGRYGTTWTKSTGPEVIRLRLTN